MSLGFVLPALSLGLGSISLRPKRGFFPSTGGKSIVAQTTVEEVHHDDMEITDHPVEQGSAITDHAFKRPAEVVIRAGFSDSPKGNSGGLLGAATGAAAALGGSALRTVIGVATTAQSLLSGNGAKQAKEVYADFVAAQQNRVLFDIYTGKRVYRNMLIKALTTTTNSQTDGSLVLTIVCRQVMIVSTRVVTLPVNGAATSDAAKFAPAKDLGQSLLKTAKNYIGPPSI